MSRNKAHFLKPALFSHFQTPAPKRLKGPGRLAITPKTAWTAVASRALGRERGNGEKGALRRVDICRWGSQWFVVSWSFVSFSLHFGTRLAVTRICTLKLICSYATQIGKEAGGSGPGGCSHFALVVGGEGREWQVAVAFSMFLHFCFSFSFVRGLFGLKSYCMLWAIKTGMFILDLTSHWSKMALKLWIFHLFALTIRWINSL